MTLDKYFVFVRNVQPLDNIQEEPGAAWVTEEDDEALSGLNEAGLRTARCA